MKIVQILLCLAVGDAIGNDTLALHKMFLEENYISEVYVPVINKKLVNEQIHRLHKMPSLGPEDVCLFHSSTGSGMLDLISSLRCKKIMIYHNITPSHYFRDYSPLAEVGALRGYQEVKKIIESRLFDYCIADSSLNRQCLLEMGFDSPIDVCPIMIPFEDYAATPDPQTLRIYGDQQIVNWVFVGRIAPNKKQEDIISAFYYYHNFMNPRSRLVLVGNPGGMEIYQHRLKDYATELGLTDSIIFTGHIRFNEILAWYRLADAFVCMSEHEGFCVPLLEAMYFNVPIFAYASSAIPETLGSSGVLLNSKDPVTCAKIIHQALSHPDEVKKIVAGQTRRLKDFQYDSVKGRFLSLLRPYLQE